jgi:type I restriction enzyme S subunit
MNFKDLTLADLAAPQKNAIVGGPFGSNLVSKDYTETGVPVIRGGNMGEKWVGGNFVYVSNEKSIQLSQNIARPNDLIFTQRGTLGQVSIVPKIGYDRYVVSQSQMKITVDPTKADVNFLYYLFNSPDQLQYIRNSAIQTGVPHTNLGILKITPIKIPPLNIQKKVASVLTGLDDRIALLRETNGTLEAIAQAMFKSWFVDFDPVRAKAEGREPEGMDAATAALFPDSFEASALSLVPTGWSTCPVYDLASYINGAAYKAFDPNLERRGLPIIKIAELKSGVTVQTAYSDVSMPEKYRIQTKDILFSWSGNPDTSIDTFVWIHGHAWLNQHIFRVLPHVVAERSFLLQTLKYLRPVFAELARNKQTTGLGHVTVADLKRLQVVKPEKNILACFDDIIAPIHTKIFNNDQMAQTLATLRDTLLPRLISGQLRLPDTDAIIEEAAA